MAFDSKFPTSPYEILDPKIRWYPAQKTLDEALWSINSSFSS